MHSLQVQAYAYVYKEGESYPSPIWEGAKSQPKRIVIFCLSCRDCQALDWLSGSNLLCRSMVPFEPKLREPFFDQAFQQEYSDII